MKLMLLEKLSLVRDEWVASFFLTVKNCEIIAKNLDCRKKIDIFALSKIA